MNLDRLFQAGIGIAIVGLAVTFWPSQAGGYYSPQRWGGSTYRHGPAVLIDRGHWNESTADPHFHALAELLSADGYRVSSSRQEFVPELLDTAKVLVVSDALGVTGWLQRFGVHPRAHAFGADETQAVREWVRRGGSLLLIADRPPAVEAAAPLAAALGTGAHKGTAFEFGKGRVVVLTVQLADMHNRSRDSRAAMLEIMHWLSRAE